MYNWAYTKGVVVSCRPNSIKEKKGTAGDELSAFYYL